MVMWDSDTRNLGGSESVRLTSCDRIVNPNGNLAQVGLDRRIFVANGFWWFEDHSVLRRVMLDPVFIRCQWRMGRLAKALCIGEKTLSRTVENSLGIRGKTWLRQVRVVSIRQVLTEESKIEAVAKHFGFSQHSDLTREFKSLIGVTPTEYLRKARSLANFL